MIRFEIKKIFSKTANKIGLIVLLAAIAVTCYFAISSMDYVDEEGDTHTGIAAARYLRDTKAEWEGLITEDVLPGTPTMLKYKTHADADSLYNTPPAYGIYICGKVFKWLKKMGGLSAMKEKNEKKAKLLYDFLDESKLFKGTVEKKDRSLMNVPFVTGDKDLDAKFVKEAKEAGLENLKGHRTVGGMRASIYNAMPYEGVEALVAFMKTFEEENA